MPRKKTTKPIDKKRSKAMKKMWAEKKGWQKPLPKGKHGAIIAGSAHEKGAPIEIRSIGGLSARLAEANGQIHRLVEAQDADRDALARLNDEKYRLKMDLDYAEKENLELKLLLNKATTCFVSIFAQDPA